MTEFDIIKQFFTRQMLQRNDVLLEIGDDCALVEAPPEHQIAITSDTLVAGVHFPLTTSAYDIGFKSLAVNLSDLAAMGATPAWFTLALTLPETDEEWLGAFCNGLFDLANRYQVQLIGGDLTEGPLSITITAHGFVPKNQALQRRGAQPGDLIYVTNTLGDAALGLALLQNKLHVAEKSQEHFLQRLNRPEPQILIGEQLRTHATAAIDISDGFAADVKHLLEKSQVGAVINVDALPLSIPLLQSTSLQQAIDFALNGGDDYELCFTAPPNQKIPSSFKCTCVGKITAGLDLIWQDKAGKHYSGAIQGYLHFGFLHEILH